MGANFTIVLVLYKAIAKLIMINDILKFKLKKLRHQRPRNWLANELTDKKWTNGPKRCMKTYFFGFT